MRSANRHEAGFYDSDAAFRALIVPFVEEGIAAGEPVVLAYDRRKGELLRSWIAKPGAVQFLENDGLDATPVGAIAAYRDLFAAHVAAGARRVRLSGELPPAGAGDRFGGWDRYESAVNVVWADFDLHCRCLYDSSTIPPQVRDVVERTHPFLRNGEGGFEPNPRYEHPGVFVPTPPEPDPLEDGDPAVELVDVMPAEARRAVEGLAARVLDPEDLYGLSLALSEAVTNGQLHGRPPVTVRMWADQDRVLIRVHDTGLGPNDPLVGLVPRSPGPKGAGLGLWLSQRLGVEVDLIATADGFTARLRAGRGAASARAASRP